jgi:hypothetical protein
MDETARTWEQPCDAFQADGRVVFVPACYGAIIGGAADCTCMSPTLPCKAVYALLDRFAPALGDHAVHAPLLRDLGALLRSAESQGAGTVSSKAVVDLLDDAEALYGKRHGKALDAWDRAKRSRAVWKEQVAPVLHAHEPLERFKEAVLGLLHAERATTPAADALKHPRQATPEELGLLTSLDPEGARPSWRR